jgi:hypothetical protein
MACVGYEWTVSLEHLDEVALAVDELDDEAAQESVAAV